MGRTPSSDATRRVHQGVRDCGQCAVQGRWVRLEPSARADARAGPAEEVLDEMARVREELGYPVMATPFSQLVGTQAVLNVVTGQRYSVIPDEVMIYAHGFYGTPVAPLDQNVLDTILSSPKAASYQNWEPPQPSLGELRARFGESISDDELILRLLVPESDIAAMRATPPRNRDFAASSRQMGFIRQLVETSVGAYLHVDAGDFSLTLEGDSH